MPDEPYKESLSVPNESIKKYPHCYSRFFQIATKYNPQCKFNKLPDPAAIQLSSEEQNPKKMSQYNTIDSIDFAEIPHKKHFAAQVNVIAGVA